jgi:tetratricopeptide (TPR) repeat protein
MRIVHFTARLPGIALALLASLALVSGVAAAPKADAVIDGFVKSVEADKSFSDELRLAVLKQVAESRKDADAQATVITDALAKLSPDFDKALIALGEEETDTAIEALKKLGESKNAYLATEAKFYLARAYMMDEEFEDAAPILADLTGPQSADKSLGIGEVYFMLGVAQAGLLKRTEAIKTLNKFVDEYPNAPERLRVGALIRIDELTFIRKGSLADVEHRMNFSRRKLDLEDSGDPTQTEQKNIISMLDKLIKEAEKQEAGS